MGCIPSKRHQLIQKIGNDFMTKKEVTALYKNPSILVYKKFEQLFGYTAEEWKAFEPSKSDVRTFHRELNLVLKQIKKGKVIGLTGSQLYTTAAVVRRNPILADVYDSFLRVNHELKGTAVSNDRDFKTLLEYLKDGSLIEGTKLGSKKAQKKLSKIDREIQSLVLDVSNGVVGSEKKLGAKQGELDELLATGEGKVYKDFITLIESKDKGLRSVKKVQEIVIERWGKPLSGKNIKDINNAILSSGITTSARMQNALSQYVKIMHDLHIRMKNGVEAYVKSIQEGMLIKGKDIEEVKNIKSFLLEKLLPDEKVGYFPHYRYDMQSLFLDGLMPKLDNLSSTTRIMDKQRGGGIDEALKDVKTYLTSRVKRRTPNLNDKDYSLNFAAVVKRYMDEINRFNFMSHTQWYTRKALREAKNAFQEGKDLEGYGAQFVEMIMDLNQAQTGTKIIEHPEFEAASRALLNFEFISKLGLNVRSGVKNATQWLLNGVHFGPVMMARAKRAYRNDRDLSASVDKALEESGLIFETGADITAIGGEGKPFTSNVRMDGLGNIEFVNPSKLSQFADFSGTVAGKSGVFMRLAENINRKSTYKYGFYEMYSELKNSDGFREVMNDKWQKARGKDITKSELDNEIFKRSKRFAERQTTLLHFDYASVSKSKAMRSKLGRFLLQFQHYAHSFAALNMKYAREGGDAALVGDFWPSGKMGKVYRMGLTYSLVPAILSAFTDLDFFRVIQHDTAERLQQWWTFFTGDEEEINKITYGRGALGALVGGPVFSDMLAIGELLNAWNLEDHELLELLVGYNDAKELSDDQKLAKIVRLFNIQAGRFTFQTGSLYANKSFGVAAQFEAGLYPTAASGKRREELLYVAEKVLPNAALDVLDKMFGTSKKKKKKKPKVAPSPYVRRK